MIMENFIILALAAYGLGCLTDCLWPLFFAAALSLIRLASRAWMAPERASIANGWPLPTGLKPSSSTGITFEPYAMPEEIVQEVARIAPLLKLQRKNPLVTVDNAAAVFSEQLVDQAELAGRRLEADTDPMHVDHPAAYRSNTGLRQDAKVVAASCMFGRWR
jgi:hypothetical protein